MVIADRPSEGTNYREFLKEDEEIVWYDSKEEAVEKTKYYLAHPEKAEKIGQNARRRVLSQHMCSNRVKNLIDILEENR
jgi:spore maturation protein CgeB